MMNTLSLFKRMRTVALLLLSLSAGVTCNGQERMVSAGTGTVEEGIPSAERAVSIEGTSGKLSAMVYLPELPEGRSCLMVVLMHGFMSDKNDRIVRAVADRLRQEHVGYVRFDFNGHGESEGRFQDMTVLNEIEDARRVYEYARTLDAVGEVALLGHSQGGVVAGMLAGELGAERVSRVVLMSPAAVLRENAQKGVLFGVRYDPDNIPEYITVFGRRVGRAYLQTAKALPVYETAARYGGPACIIHGTEDDIVPCAYGVRFDEGYEDAVVRLIEGDDHSFSRHFDEAVSAAVDFLLGTVR